MIVISQFAFGNYEAAMIYLQMPVMESEILAACSCTQEHFMMLRRGKETNHKNMQYLILKILYLFKLYIIYYQRYVFCHVFGYPVINTDIVQYT
ncbi:hypothetical protein C0J52_18160 [Blattella germanica]|nr:hypothetical protein C0J52_18160 [Blattella germanica]